MAKPTGTAQKPASRTDKDKLPSLTSLAFFFGLQLLIPLYFWSDSFKDFIPTRVKSLLSPRPTDDAYDRTVLASPSTCNAHKYTTEIISRDPLVIYINNFTSLAEANELVAAGEPDFEDSFVKRESGKLQRVSGRTSQSAPLEPDLPLVKCILGRARSFMGSMLQPDEPFSVPQLVRYYPGQRYDLHTDFWGSHQILNDGSGRRFNRVASFFVFLKANCTEGETYFPLVDVLDRDAERGGRLAEALEGKAERGEVEGETRGIKFKPIAGNAIFWVNVDEEGNGDRRLVHAGLPVGEGEKIGMNIWPRKFY